MAAPMSLVRILHCMRIRLLSSAMGLSRTPTEISYIRSTQPQAFSTNSSALTCVCLTRIQETAVRYRHISTTSASNAIKVHKRNEPAKATKTVVNLKETVLVFDTSDVLIGQSTLLELRSKAEKENMKILNIGRNSDGVSCYRYLTGEELRKESMRLKAEKRTNKSKELKEVIMTLKITDHDLQVKMNQAIVNLNKGHGIKIKIKGDRNVEENMVNKLQSELLKKISQKLKDVATVEKAVKDFKMLSVRVLPKESIADAEEEQ